MSATVRACVALALVFATACDLPQVPTERMRIQWVHEGRHGHYEKGFVPLEGWTCGEQYQRAVDGSPEAAATMARCARHNAAYGWLMTSFIAVPALSFAGAELFIHDHQTRNIVIGIGFGVGLAAFALGLLAGATAQDELHDAIEQYNVGMPRR